MPPLYLAVTLATAAHRNIEAAYDGAPVNFLISRLAALKLYPTSAMRTLLRLSKMTFSTA